MLGYMEVSWSDSAWAASPPVLTLLPAGGGYGILLGARTRYLADRLRLAELSSSDLLVLPRRQPQGPDALYIGATDETHVESLAAQLGIPYETSVPERLSRLLPPLDSALDVSWTTDPPGGWETSRWDPGNFHPTHAEGIAGPGLYRIEVHYRSRWRFVDDSGKVFNLDGPTGFYAELRRTGQHVLCYTPESPNGTLEVPLGAPLPSLHARAAALCTGLMPAESRSGHFRSHTRSFANVPKVIAQRIAESLGQRLVMRHG